MHSHVCCVIHNSQDMENMFIIDKWIKKIRHNIYNRILLCHEKEGNPASCKDMEDPEGIMLSEISQRKINKYYMILLKCVI